MQSFGYHAAAVEGPKEIRQMACLSSPCSGPVSPSRFKPTKVPYTTWPCRCLLALHCVLDRMVLPHAVPTTRLIHITALCQVPVHVSCTLGTPAEQLGLARWLWYPPPPTRRGVLDSTTDARSWLQLRSDALPCSIVPARVSMVVVRVRDRVA